MKIILEESDIAAALSAYISTMPMFNVQGSTPEIHFNTLDDSVEAEISIGEANAEATPKPRRKRRTKAEMRSVQEQSSNEDEEDDSSESTVPNVNSATTPAPFAVEEESSSEPVEAVSQSKSLFG